MTFTFMSNNGTYVSVTDNNEADARKLAMAKLYGPMPSPSWLGSKWLGLGLLLKETAQ